MRSCELQGIATSAHVELTLVVTALEEAAGVVPSDYENLEAHVYGAVSVLKTSLARLEELENALGDCRCDYEAEGVA